MAIAYRPDLFPNKIPLAKIQGRGEITVSAKGIANGLSTIPNDGADAGPDTTYGSISFEIGTPYTKSSGINESLNYLNSQDSSGTVKLGSGVFYISETIVMNGVGTQLIGQGPANLGLYLTTTSLGTKNRASLIYAANSFNEDMLEAMGFNQLIENVGFYQNPVNNTYDPSYHSGFTSMVGIGYKNNVGTPYHVSIVNCSFDEPLNIAIYVQNSGDVSDHWIVDNLIQNDSVDVSPQSSGILIDTETIYTGGHSRVLGNRILAMSGFGITVYDNSTTIAFNKIDLNGGTGISVNGSFQNVINNFLVGNGGDGIAWNSSGGYCGGNTILGSNASNGGYSGISFNGGYGFFSGNRIDGSATYGSSTARSQYGIGFNNSTTAGFFAVFKDNLLSGAYLTSPVQPIGSYTGILFDASNIGFVPASVAGTTAGSFVPNMTVQEPYYKKVVIYLDGYENDTTTAQTYTFPVPFTTVAAITSNTASVPGVSTSLTTFSIAPDTTTAYTGIIVIEGY